MPTLGPQRREPGRKWSRRDAIESGMEGLALLLYRNPVATLVVVAVALGALSSQIPKITYDASNEALFRRDDPSRLEYAAFRERFGGTEMVIIGVSPPEVFDFRFLARLRSLHEDLEREVPHVREISSLINARSTRGEGDVLIVEELLERWPEGQGDLASLRARVLSNPVYRNHLVSSHGRFTALVIETKAFVEEPPGEEDVLAGFDEDEPAGAAEARGSHYLSDDENREVVEAIHRVADRYRGPDFTMSIAGGPVIYEVMSRSQRRDMFLCVSLTVIVVAAFLALIFRRVSGVVIPEIIVLSALASTVGVMALVGVTLKVPTTIIPGFLLSVGVGDSVHVLAIFYRRIQQGDAKESAVAYAFRHSGVAIVMTTLTTAAGLLSFSFAELAAIADVGIYCALSVGLALLYSFVMIPPLLALIPVRVRPVYGENRQVRLMDRLLVSTADFATGHPRKILSVSLLLFLASALFLHRLHFSHDVVDWFPDSFAVKRDVGVIDRELDGSIPLEVVLDTGRRDGVLDPTLLKRMEELSDRLRGARDGPLFVGKVFSINDILKETNQALHGNDAAYYSLPQRRDLIAQQLLLFESSGSDDLEKLVDREYRTTRMTIKTPWVDAVVFEDFIHEVAGWCRDSFGSEVDVGVTGVMALMARTVPAALHTMAMSYLIAVLVISLMMIAMLGSIKMGAVSMIPNLHPILVVLGLMGLAGAPMDLISMLMFSIAIGLVVDDTVHFMYNFQRYFGISGDAREAVRETLLGTGRALLVTSLAICLGFSTLGFASLESVNRFGLFTGLTILLALAADFLMAPALVVLVTKGRTR